MSLRRAKDIFLDAIDLPANQRTRFVDSTCGDDTPLRDEVRRLLDDHDRIRGTFLHNPAAPSPASWTSGGAASDEDESPGATIGACYTLDHKLGEGGFGTVWLARQTTPIDRMVAIKILKPGLAGSRMIAARFEAERHTLARMDHPGIARVLDAGATATGRPYFVMEFVGDAVPITDYVRSHTLPLRDRVRLIERVCLAVQHAHTKGVIHRDIKPGNVLVSTSNGSPVPRVIDFGIAKAIDSNAAVLTQDLQVIGTPQYMSPEQAAGASRLVDTRSDVYSLGALLYELACDAPPFDADQLRRFGWTEAMKLLREVDPPAPSTRTREPIDAEVDWITMKALEKEPSRRYQSAAELAADVQRYLSGRAVEAGPATAAYRVRKFVARHTLALAAGSVVAAALVIATGVSVAMLVNARRAEAQAIELARAAQRAEEDAAQKEAIAATSAGEARTNLDRAASLAGFTNKLITGIDPSVAQGRDTGLMHDLLSDASKRLDEKSASLDPTVRVALRGMIGDAYLSLEQVPDALREYRKAKDVITTSGDADDADSINAMIGYGNALADADEFEEAETVLRDATARLERLGRGDSISAANALNNLATTVSARGRADEALALLQRVVDIRQRRQGSEHKLTLVARGNLASAYKSLGKAEQARDIWADLLPTMRRVLGPTDPRTLVTLGNLGTTYEQLNDDVNAEKCFRETLLLRRQIHPAGSPALVRPIGNLGGLLQRTGRLEEAESLLGEALSVSRTSHGPEHDLTLLSQTRLAGLYRSQKKFDQAIPLAQQTIDAYRKKEGPLAPGLLRSLALLMAINSDADRFADALAAFRKELPDGIPQNYRDAEIERSLHVNAARAYVGIGDLHAAKRHAAAARSVQSDVPFPAATLKRLEEIESQVRASEAK
jgi:eukaryotic-like serine/threonine-protein kinase